MKRVLSFLIITALAAVAASAGAEDVIRLGNLKFAHYGAISYMKELAPKYGLRIEERVFPKGLDIMPAIIADEIDAAASAADAAIAARAKGVPIIIVAGFARGGARIVGRSDMKWRSVKDLKGKKVGVARGGAHEIALLAELAKHGLSWSEKPGEKDVQIIYMAYADLNQALLSRNIDATCQSEPYASQAINRGFGTEIMKPYDTPMGDPIRALMITEHMYNKKRDVAERFVKCFVEATKYFSENPQQAEKYVRDVMFKGQITSDDYRDAIGNSPFTYNITIDHVQTTTDLMAKYGVGKMSNTPLAKDYVKLDLLTKAKRALHVK